MTVVPCRQVDLQNFCLANPEERERATTVRFVVLGDLHFTVYNDKNLSSMRDEFFNRLFQSVREQRPDAVVAVGDVTDRGLPVEFEGLNEALRRNNLNMITVNGNHDLQTLTKDEIRAYTGNLTDYFSYDCAAHGTRQLRLPDVAPAPLSEDAARFVIMDTPKELELVEYGGFVDDQQLEWLGREVETSQDKPLFVFGHHPLRWATRWSALPKLNIDNSRVVRQTFERKSGGYGFYFCGHNHTNSIHRQKNWTYIQSAAPLRAADFRVIDWSPEAFELQTVSINNRAETLKMATRLVAAIDDFNIVAAKGLNRDRTLSLRLNSNRVQQEAAA